MVELRAELLGSWCDLKQPKAPGESSATNAGESALLNPGQPEPVPDWSDPWAAGTAYGICTTSMRRHNRVRHLRRSPRRARDGGGGVLKERMLLL